MKSLIKIIMTALVFSPFLASTSWSAKATKSALRTPPILAEVTKKYRSAVLVEMSVEQSSKSVLGKERKVNGKISMASGKFRLESEMPEKSLLVFDGASLWSVQFPSPDFPGDPQVTRKKIKGGAEAGTIFVGLLTKDSLNQHFIISGEETLGDQVTYKTETKEKDLSIRDLQIVVDQKKKIVSQIRYKDDLQQETVMTFSDVKFLKKMKSNPFSYKPPKGVKVDEL